MTGELRPILRPEEVAELFRVDPKTVSRWAASGKLRAFKTLGGNYRFHRSDVEAALQAPFEPEPEETQ